MKQTLLSILMATTLAQATESKLWYEKPATRWEQEALPIGNGRLGAMVFGGVVYHFYCAVGDQGRLIGLATSKDLKAQAKPNPKP